MQVIHTSFVQAFVRHLKTNCGIIISSLRHGQRTSCYGGPTNVVHSPQTAGAVTFVAAVMAATVSVLVAGAETMAAKANRREEEEGLSRLVSSNSAPPSSLTLPPVLLCRQ